ncbi:MAG TPA: hypothetical protein VKQ72_14455 [Aggregatilineales bacterium]|nr:hypothetical protein [Aggregatilineales bacterium]
MFDLFATFISVLLLTIFIIIFLPVAFGQAAQALLDNMSLESSPGGTQADNKENILLGHPPLYSIDGEIRLEPPSFAVKRLHFHHCQGIETAALKRTLRSQNTMWDSIP